MLEFLTDLTAFVFELCWLVLFIARSFGQTLAQCVLPLPAKKTLTGMVAVVTGAGHGIGRELALQLSRMGVRVVCWDVNATTCDQTASDVNAEGGQAWALEVDVGDRKQVAEAAQKTRALVGDNVSLLFNNAGIFDPCKPFMRQAAEEIENIFRVNVFSQMWLVNEFWEEMTKTAGCHLISLSSTAGLCGRPNITTYCATKYAISGFTEAFHVEEVVDKGNSNANVSTVYPFIINTGLAKRPISRFPLLFPTTSAEECAKVIIDGVQRNKRTIYIPKRMEPLFALQSIVPQQVKVRVMNFFGVGVLAHE